MAIKAKSLKTVSRHNASGSTSSTALQNTQGLLPNTLVRLRHLDITDRVTVDFSVPSIAKGGYGEVYIGICKIDGREVKVAVKRLYFHLGNNPGSTKSIAKEINTWSEFTHPNIVPLIGFILEGNGLPALVSTWMDNGPVLQYVRSHPECDITHLILGAAEGLAYLHEKDVVHADIKSGNILVSSSGDAVICDFGLSRAVNLIGNIPVPDTAVGSIRWLSYELLAKNGKYAEHTKESDVWAFGMTVYELLTKEHPYAQITIDAQVMVSIMHKKLPTPPWSFSTWPRKKKEIWAILSQGNDDTPGHPYVVSRGTDGRGGAKVAILRMHPDFKDQPAKLIAKDIYVWSKLVHPNIITLKGFIKDETGFPAIILEWIDNNSVLDYVKDHPDCDVLHLIVGIAKGLEYLHDNDVVHADIRSDNVLVSSSGDVKIWSLGTSRATNATQISLGGNTTRPDGPVGAIRWMAYELLVETENYTKHSKASDVWAFGMTIYELLAQERPYAHITTETGVIVNVMNRKLPSRPKNLSKRTHAVWDLCQACWKFNPRLRISMADVVKKLEGPQ
ncbi:hypothetical protein M0805_001221 [Coniferiporia weirii]|nr:hypothetical protein M0805_001221 [Coniferiporia weirii]